MREAMQSALAAPLPGTESIQEGFSTTTKRSASWRVRGSVGGKWRSGPDTLGSFSLLPHSPPCPGASCEGDSGIRADGTGARARGLLATRGGRADRAGRRLAGGGGAGLDARGAADAAGGLREGGGGVLRAGGLDHFPGGGGAR